MSLWHFRSDVLKGFYASDVFASAISKDWAVKKAGEAFDNYVKSYHKNMGFWPLIEDCFNEEGNAKEQIAQVRQLFLSEAQAKFKTVGEASILTIS